MGKSSYSATQRTASPFAPKRFRQMDFDGTQVAIARIDTIFPDGR